MLLKSPRIAIIFVALAAMGTGFCGGPIQEFFQLIDQANVTTYQCFRNGTTFEPAEALGVRVLWVGQPSDKNKAVGYVTFTEPGQPQETTLAVNAEYIEGSQHALLGQDINLYQLLPPVNGTAYFFKQVNVTDGSTVFKIYDTEETCVNAEALHDSICTMEYVRLCNGICEIQTTFPMR
ncbi:uncharacterized protein LOC144179349 isoform X1 [Haemaphysalis longicornis]